MEGWLNAARRAGPEHSVTLSASGCARKGSGGLADRAPAGSATGDGGTLKGVVAAGAVSSRFPAVAEEPGSGRIGFAPTDGAEGIAANFAYGGMEIGN